MSRRFGREICEQTSDWVKNVKIFVSHVNVYQRATSAKEDFNNQLQRMTYSEDTSESLTPGALLIAQWACEQSGHGCRDGDYA